jgi:hypothetical protein
MIQNANLWLIFEGDALCVSLRLCMSLSLYINPRFGFTVSKAARSDIRTQGMLPCAAKPAAIAARHSIAARAPDRS